MLQHAQAKHLVERLGTRGDLENVTLEQAQIGGCTVARRICVDRGRIVERVNKRARSDQDLSKASGSRTCLQDGFAVEPFWPASRGEQPAARQCEPRKAVELCPAMTVPLHAE